MEYTINVPDYQGHPLHCEITRNLWIEAYDTLGHVDPERVIEYVKGILDDLECGVTDSAEIGCQDLIEFLEGGQT